MRWLSTAAVAVLLLTAGCNAFVGAEAANQGTVTPAPVPTAAESDTATTLDSPPGVPRSASKTSRSCPPPTGRHSTALPTL
nr:hypothetical protein [Haloarcula sp. CBA1122]